MCVPASRGACSDPTWPCYPALPLELGSPRGRAGRGRSRPPSLPTELVLPAACLLVTGARPGPDQRPQRPTLAPPTEQEYHYHAGARFMANRCHVRNGTDTLV
ncbi:hypothetical protein FQN60_013042 [Etheostoma spectabile]|uniref:Uncharacterized protein n=1 Tax=Etheostoma spectabile TaxID=54343 RepID=A0A5J5D6H9_9PERO|nr:hypothetical protein FQN60_013042 [Etheostoma spectabile]